MTTKVFNRQAPEINTICRIVYMDKRQKVEVNIKQLLFIKTVN